VLDEGTAGVAVSGDDVDDTGREELLTQLAQ
jgi:hypothetical protein